MFSQIVQIDSNIFFFVYFRLNQNEYKNEPIAIIYCTKMPLRNCKHVRIRLLQLFILLAGRREKKTVRTDANHKN